METHNAIERQPFGRPHPAMADNAPDLDQECITSVSTFQLNPADRIREWPKIIGRLLCLSEAGVESENAIGFEQIGAGFSGQADCLEFDDMRLLKISASGHRLTIQPNLAGTLASRTLLVFQYRGTSVFQCQGRTVKLEPGQLAVLPTTDPLEIVNDQPIEQCFLWFTSDREWPQNPRDLQTHLFSGDTLMQRLLRGFVLNMLTESKSCTPVAQRLLGATVALMVRQIIDEGDLASEKTSRSSATPDQIIRYIENNLHDSELSPDSIARAFGLSKRSIHRAFKRKNNTECLNRYLWHRRIERCALELRKSGPDNDKQTVAEVAYAHGFSSSAHFSRVFKQYIGTPPLRYKQGR